MTEIKYLQLEVGDIRLDAHEGYPLSLLTDRGFDLDSEDGHSAIVTHSCGAISFVYIYPQDGGYHVEVHYKSIYKNKTGYAIKPEFLVVQIEALEIPPQLLKSVKWKIEKRDRLTAEDSVYFIRADNGLIKIGFSSNVASRIKSLRCTSPIELELLTSFPGDINTERQLHKRFAARRTHGEWFSPHKDLLDYIEEVKKEVTV